MIDFLNWFSPESLQRLIGTAVLVALMVVGRIVVGRVLKKRISSWELRHRWLVRFRTASILLLVLGLAVIWASELRGLALSVFAIAAAIVIATKELILCLSGSLLKAGAGSFDIGDRIQVKDIRGDVIDQNLLATTVMEIGPGKLTHQRTGRVIVLPNSLFVAEPVTNESYSGEYVLHVFTVPMKRSEDWRSAQKSLLAAATRHCFPYLEATRKQMVKLSEAKGLDTPTVEPRVAVQLGGPEELSLVVRVPVQARRRGFLEQAIIRDYLEETRSAETPRAAEPAPSAEMSGAENGRPANPPQQN